MTFGALAAWQAWLLTAAAAAVAAAVFSIRVRPPRRFVPSLVLWRRVLDDARELTLWERIRRAVSLAATVLAALLLALAVAQPGPRSRAGGASGERVLVVLDSSWSMLARTGSGETRWDRAVAQARRIVAAAGGEVAVATTADGLVEAPTRDRALVGAALDAARPSGGGDATAWPRLAGVQTVHFVTDGAVARPLDPAVVVHSVFEPAPNVAITAFEVRRSLDGSRAGEAYLEAANYAGEAQRARLVVSRGDAALIDRDVEMAPGETLRQTFPVARGGDGVLRARIAARLNALDVDDEAHAFAERAGALKVAIVGEDTRWLRALLGRDPGISPAAADPSDFERAARNAAVLIFDRWTPPQPPRQPALYFAPEAGRAAAEEREPRWARTLPHPVVRGVDPMTLTIDRARAYGDPGLTPIAWSARGTPLVYVREGLGRRAVVVTFGAAESNLASAPAFPVLVGGALDWLASPVPAGERRPGLATLDGAIASLDGPRGGAVPLVRLHDGVAARLSLPGLYVAHAAGTSTTLTVNAGEPQASNLLRTTLAPGTAEVAPGRSQRPWWVVCAAAVFALVLVEWITWVRRITV